MLLLPFGGRERVCLGMALAELEIRLLAVGMLKQLSLELEPDQDLTLRLIPAPDRRMACCAHAVKPPVEVPLGGVVLDLMSSWASHLPKKPHN